MKRGTLCCVMILAIGWFVWESAASGQVQMNLRSRNAQGHAAKRVPEKNTAARVLNFVRNKRIKIRSETATAELVPTGRRVVLEGDVRVTQGDLTLTCDRMVALWKKEKGKRVRQTGRRRTMSVQVGDLEDLRSLTCTGNVKIVQGDRMAIAGKAVYDHQKRTIKLTSGAENGPKPQLWQGPDNMLADMIIIYIEQNRIEFKNGDRTDVQIYIQPRKQKGQE